jgi:hypothetical protein
VKSFCVADTGRVVNALVVIALAYLLLTQLWKPVKRLAGWFILPTGQASNGDAEHSVLKPHTI